MTITNFVNNTTLYATDLNTPFGQSLAKDGSDSTMTGPLTLNAGGTLTPTGTLSAAINYVNGYPDVPTQGYAQAFGRYVVNVATGGTNTGIRILDNTIVYVDGTEGDSWWPTWHNYNAASAENANGTRSDVVVYVGGSRQVSPQGASLGRTAVPSAYTTVATTLASPGTAVAVENLAYLQWTYPANSGATEISPTNPGTVIIGTGTYEITSVSGTGTVDPVMGVTGPGTIITTANVSTADATAGNQVIGCVRGEPIEALNVNLTDFSGWDTNRAGGLNHIEFDLNAAGPDSQGQTSALPGVPVGTYGLLNGSAGGRYFQAFYPNFTAGNLGALCPYSKMEFHSYQQFQLGSACSVKQGLLFYGGGEFVCSILDTRSITRGAGAYSLRVNSGDGIAWGGNVLPGGLYGNGGESVIMNTDTAGVGAGYPKLTYQAGGASGYLTPGMKTRGGLGLAVATTLTVQEFGYRVTVSAGAPLTLPLAADTLNGEGMLVVNQDPALASIVSATSPNLINVVGTTVASLALLPGDYVHFDTDGIESWWPISRSNLAGSGGPALTTAQLQALVSSLSAHDTGRRAFATDAIANSTEPTGTGCPATFNYAVGAWIADWSGVAITTTQTLPRTVAANFTITASDHNRLIAATAVPITGTIAAGLPDGFIARVCDATGSASPTAAITLDLPTSNTIAGQSTFVVNTAYATGAIENVNGTIWAIA